MFFKMCSGQYSRALDLYLSLRRYRCIFLEEEFELASFWKNSNKILCQLDLYFLGLFDYNLNLCSILVVLYVIYYLPQTILFIMYLLLWFSDYILVFII